MLTPMSPPDDSSSASMHEKPTPSTREPIVAALFGGGLMGLANLVPGISGGTMLLATGVYPRFVRAVADVTAFRWRIAHLILLGAIGLGAVIAVLAAAGPVRDLVLDHRWVMYSLFIGLTLGGAPIIWRMLTPIYSSGVAGVIVGFFGMIALAAVQNTGLGTAGILGGAPWLMLFVAGAAGGAAMILPGLSGGYLLLVLGQYVIILTAISGLKDGLTGRDVGLLQESIKALLPFGVGLVMGVVGVSHIMEQALRRFPQPTLGVLLGLLLGAVFGLWPFIELRPPVVGDVIRGIEIVNESQIAEVRQMDWPGVYFQPSAVQSLVAAVAVAGGLIMTSLIGRLDRKKPRVVDG